MQIIDGKLVLGKKNCSCGDGTMSTPIACRECKGTGNGKRGGARGCKKCYGMGREYDHDNRSTCNICKGEFKDFDDESICDYLPANVFPNMTFRVYYTNNMTVGESLIGLGCVFSCGDYGDAWRKREDDNLIAHVKAHNGIQATKIAKDDGTVCDHVGIFVSTNGYTVKPVFKTTPAV